jgi:hypothetical protein
MGRKSQSGEIVMRPALRMRPATLGAFLGALALSAATAAGLPSGGSPGPRSTLPAARYWSSRRVVMPPGVRALAERAYKAASVPAFSRQTGLACSACHYQFPQLTPFGRLFKLNGYSIVGLKVITEPDKKKRSSLELLPISPLAVMFQTSFTHLGKPTPGTQNDDVAFPQQFSLFLGGSVGSHFGALIQTTYDGADGTFGIDNSDLRYANRTQLAQKNLIYGVTLHNNPTVEDVWNTTPAWGFPFAGSEITPSSIAGTMVDGSFAQDVLGLGGYALWNNLLYVEATGYRSAPQGVLDPDTTAVNAIDGITPYWRVALEHQFGPTYGMIGAYGLDAHTFPVGVTGPTDAFSDVAVDAQIEHPIRDGAVVILRWTSIFEQQTLPALFDATPQGAANLHNTLTTTRVNATYEPSGLFGGTLGYFSTTGTRDSLLYAPGALTGSRTGRPNTNGLIEEIDFNPRENIRVAIQGVEFTTFNGATESYDASGRQAWNNNTLYLLLWLAF